MRKWTVTPTNKLMIAAAVCFTSKEQIDRFICDFEIHESERHKFLDSLQDTKLLAWRKYYSQFKKRAYPVDEIEVAK